MEYLNIHTSTLDSPEFVGADQIERGTWLCLQRYCIGQENSGVIPDCGKWKDRQWQQLCRVTLREVRREARLFRWEGMNLRVFYYPLEAEEKVIRKRLVAQENGKSGGRPLKNPEETQSKPMLVFSEKAKGKEKEWKENNTPLPPFRGDERTSEEDLISQIKSLRKAWQVTPHLSSRERRLFRQNFAIFADCKPDDWQVQRAFLAASLPEGSALFQPALLRVYLTDPGATLGHAWAWKGKQRPRLAVLPDAPRPVSEEDAAALAEFLNKPKRIQS